MKLFAIALTLIALSVNAQVVINEFSCSNRNGITDVFGETEDWIELYNTGTSAEDLTGYFLSDKSGNLTKWEIPSAIIPPGGYLVVQCSGRDMIQGGELHTNFKLTQTKNEWIILTNPASVVEDSLRIINLTKEDHSVGRETDGAAVWKLFTSPTPGTANTGAQNFYTPKPLIDIQPGFYASAQTVSMTCADATATIRYTLDGSEPTNASTAYSGPVNIATTSLLRAKAFSSNLPSFTESNSYFIGVTHTLPVLSIGGVGVFDLIANGALFNGPNQIGCIELFEEDGSFIDEGEGDYNKHGNDSWAYDQRGFDFIMRDQYGHNSALKHQIFPDKNRDEFQRVIVKAAANDNYPFENGAHIRDSYVHTLSQKADLKMDERTWRPCILYINGEYWGVYEIREKVDDSDFTDHYYDQDKFNLQYLKTWGGTWEEYGAPNAQPDWDAFTQFVANNNMGDAANFNVADSLLNWESLVDYFVMNSFIVSQDWLNWNTAWWRGRDPQGDKKKWRYTLWDMDASFGHYVNYTGIPDASANADPCNVENLPDPGGQGHTAVLQKLINENPIVEQYYKTRYIDLANTYFSCDYLNELLDSMLLEIAPEMPAQIAKWGGTAAGYAAAVQQLKDFIDARCTAIQAGLVNCYNLAGPYDITVDVFPAGAGEVRVNSIWAPFYVWNASYYGGIETKLRAKANTGYEFVRWEYTNGPLLYNDSIDTNSVDLIGNEDIVAIFREIDEPEVIYGSTSVNLPSGFSPDGDGQNDFLKPIVGEDVLNFRLLIFDRWGNRVLWSVDPFLAWDGTFNGQPLNPGVFAYSIDITYKDGTKETKSGNVTLIR